MEVPSQNKCGILFAECTSMEQETCRRGAGETHKARCRSAAPELPAATLIRGAISTNTQSNKQLITQQDFH